MRGTNPGCHGRFVKVLYLTYDGLADHIGQSQVLPYLLGCARAGHRITVVSFEKPTRMQALGEAVESQCAEAGIAWKPQRFRSSPPVLAKAIDMRSMRRAAHKALREAPFDLLHCRSYPAASVGLQLKRKYGTPLLFDMRGFWPDQRREGGRWPANTLFGRALYEHWKKVEAALYAQSDHILVLTAAAREIVANAADYRGAPVSVIPCCADFELFSIDEPERAAARAELGIDAEEPVLAYLGSLGTVYRLDAILRLFAAARQHSRGLKLLFVGSGSVEPILAEAQRLDIEVKPGELRSVTASRDGVVRWLNAGDVGLCFCTPTFSSLGVSATKIGEYLACGLPVIGNRQIGDLAQILGAVDGGNVLDDLSQASLELAGEQVPKLLRAKRSEIRDRASRFLDLARAVDAYDAIYTDLHRPVMVGP